MDRFNVFGTLRTVPKYGPQVRNHAVDRMFVVQELTFWPKQLLKLGAGNHSTRALQEDSQEARRLFRYPEPFVPTKKIARRQIKFVVQEGHQPEFAHKETLHE